MKIMFMTHGLTAVFDDNDQQVPELQESWLKIYAEFFESKGYDPVDHDFELSNRKHVKFHRTEDGLNFSITPN